MQYDDVITNPRWRTDAILKIVFSLYLGAILADQREIWNRDEGSHADIGHVTKIAIFANSRWRTAAILKIALSPYLSRELNLLTSSLTTFLFCAAADFTHLLCSVLQISTKHVLLKYTDSRTFKYLCCFQDFPCLANYSCLPCLAKIQGLSRTCGHPVL